MREFKFRAWDKVEEQWIEMRRMGFLENGESWYVEDYEENEPPYFTDRDNWILMQYTGLKDCNGVDIYEGDILSTDLSRRYLTVEFRNGAFVFQCHDEGNDYYDTMTSIDSVEVFKTEYHKVIGNIYENKDLLIK